MSRRQRGDVLRLVMSLASRPEGLSRAELAQRITLSSNAPILSNACKAGHIFKAKKPGIPMRYFITQRNADEWLAIPAPPKPPKRRPGRPRKTEVTPKPAAVKAKKPHIPKPLDHQKPPTYTAGPSKNKAPISGEPQGMDKAPRIVATTPLPRFHVPEDFQGVFSRAGVGRDAETGQPWEATA